MEILSVFSVADFLAYLFPGILSLSGIYLLLLATPLQPLIQLPKDSMNIGIWLVLLVISYVVGVLISTVIGYLFRERPGALRRKQNKGNIQIHDQELKIAVVSAFDDLILSKKVISSKKTKESASTSNWNEYRYYVCRSLVTEIMPRAGASGIREGAYRQLRMNLIGSVAIWGIVGLVWGLRFLTQTYSTGRNTVVDEAWVWMLIISSVVVPIILIRILRIFMDSHEQREVREILTSFLAGYNAGIFDKRDR
jgi:hypothetical protein